MDMFNKARQKVKAAVKDVHATIQQPQAPWNQQQSQSQQYPPPQQYQAQPQYPPQGQHQPSHQHNQPPQQYYSPPPQHPVQGQYFPPQYPNVQQYTPPLHHQPYQQPPSAYSPPIGQHGTPQYQSTVPHQQHHVTPPLHPYSPYGHPGGSQATQSPPSHQVYSAPPASLASPSHFQSPPPPQQLPYSVPAVGAQITPTPSHHQAYPYSPPIALPGPTSSQVPAPQQKLPSGVPAASEIHQHSPQSLTSADPNLSNQSGPPSSQKETHPASDLSNQLGSMQISGSASEVPVPSQPAQQSRSLSASASAYAVTANQSCPGMQATLEDYIQFYVMTETARTDKSGEIQPETAVTICSHCFHKHIAHYPMLATSFRPLPRPPPAGSGAGQKISYGKYVCDFYMPQVFFTFYQLCVPQNSVAGLLEHGNTSLKMKYCGRAVVNGQYYTNNAIPDFGACETCFQYFIRRTPFESNFSKTTSIVDPWICDIGYTGYVHRQLISNLKSSAPNFSAFVTEARMYLGLPSCPGEGQTYSVRGQDDVWVFAATQEKAGSFCQKCFYDDVQGSTLECKFSVLEKLTDSFKIDLHCEMAVNDSRFFFEKAKRTGDDEVWRRPLSLKDQTPDCPSVKGLDETEVEQQITTHGLMAQWHCFKDFPELEFCHRCYITFVEVVGASHLTVPITRPLKKGVIRQCILSPSKYPTHSTAVINNFESPLHWRSQLLRNGLGYGWDSHGDWEPAIYLADISSKWAPPCGLNTRCFTPASGRKWYGRFAGDNDPTDVTMVMCGECRENHVKEEDGTAFENYLDHDITEEIYKITPPEGYMCHFYGRTTQTKIREFGAKNDWNGFVQHMKKRKDTGERWHAWKDILDQQNVLTRAHVNRINAQTQQNIQLGSIRLQQQLTANMNATIMGIGGSVAEAASPDTGYRYGNSNIGMGYLTAAGANAAQAHWNASRLPVAAENPGPVPMHITSSIGNTGDVSEDLKYILGQFDIVTNEWRAIE